MPTTRRSTGGARARQGPAKGQSTISFSNKVSKPVAKQDVKDSLVSGPKTVVTYLSKKEEEPAEEEPNVEDVKVPNLATKEEEEEEVDEEDNAEDEEEEEVDEDELAKSAAVLRAEKISDAQVAKYWKSIEAGRVAPQVHAKDLSTGEKVLRYFDVSSQYGPCIGIQRRKRWERAEKLGLEPPIEVLAVLLKEEREDGGKGHERAHMDEILNSTAVGS